MADSAFMRQVETITDLRKLKASYWNTVLALSLRQSYGVGDKQLVSIQLSEAKEMFRAAGEEIQRRETIEAGGTQRSTRTFYPDFSGADPG